MYRIARAADGTMLPSLAVDLPLKWARRHAQVEVVITGGGGATGRHARVLGDDGEIVMTFPWLDHADVALRKPPPWELPVEIADGRWDDVEQGWWASIVQVDDMLYLAETDFDAIPAITGKVALEQGTPGLVFVNGVEVRWHCVPEHAHDAAWRAARERLLRH